MALTEDQILQQINVLAVKTSDNPDMVYKANATLNKGLNPAYFTGNNTKIVNAINVLAAQNAANEAIVQNISDKVNSILLDASTSVGAEIWEETKELMETDTIIEGINNILSGNLQDKILGFDIDDSGKVLIVQADEEGGVKTVAKYIEEIVDVSKLEYSNNKVSSINNVQAALDYLFENQGQGEQIPVDVEWVDIKNKPEIGSQLELSDDSLVLKNEEGTAISEIQLVTDEEIDDLLDFK